MRSVADQLRLETHARVRNLPVMARIGLSLRLGDEDVALYARHANLECGEARRRLRAQRAGRAWRRALDIDLLTTDTGVLEHEWWTPLAVGDVTVDVRRGGPDDPLAGIVRIETPADRPVDLVVGRHAWQARAVARAERASAGPPVVTALDLILLKTLRRRSPGRVGRSRAASPARRGEPARGGGRGAHEPPSLHARHLGRRPPLTVVRHVDAPIP